MEFEYVERGKCSSCGEWGDDLASRECGRPWPHSTRLICRRCNRKEITRGLWLMILFGFLLISLLGHSITGIN